MGRKNNRDKQSFEVDKQNERSLEKLRRELIKPKFQKDKKYDIKYKPKKKFEK